MPNGNFRSQADGVGLGWRRTKEPTYGLKKGNLNIGMQKKTILNLFILMITFFYINLYC